MCLEDDSVGSLLPVSGPRIPSRSVSDNQDSIVFFKPVDGSLAHLTILGDSIRKCDFVAQVYGVLSTEVNSATGRVAHVTLGPAFGEPKLVRFSHLPYGTLSSKLCVWEFSETGYHVRQEMSPGLT